jgi:hypothetical protein
VKHAQLDCARSRRLAANLYRSVRPTLALQPRRENTYIALEALARVAAKVLDSLEDRNAMDFFTLALTQCLEDCQKNGKRDTRRY